jgi:hypothetical protein
MGDAHSKHGIEEKCMQSFGSKIRRIPLSRFRHRLKDNIKMELRKYV